MMEITEELETLKHIPNIIAKFMDNVPEDRLDVRRDETAWTIREHFLHIVQVQEMLLGRIKLIRESENPVIEPYFPEEDDIENLGIEEALRKYRRFRKKQIEEIESCSRKELERRADHKEYTDYSIPIIVRHMIFHEYWHMYRLEEILYTKDGFFR